jgi:hypothetical protein
VYRCNSSGDLSEWTTMTENLKKTLRKKAHRWLVLYVEELGAFLPELTNNEDGWLVGYDEAEDYYWVTPRTADGRTLPPPIMTIKWEGAAIEN